MQKHVISRKPYYLLISFTSMFWTQTQTWNHYGLVESKYTHIKTIRSLARRIALNKPV